ncbi:MAG: porin [Pseudomonadota bacterium]
MKRVLFASTALVAFAGAAAADVTLTGNAEMGIFDNDDVDEVQFHTDIDVTFTMSGETDGGLTFGATIDLDESDDGDAFANDTQGGETIFLSGGFGTVTMGDTDGALDWALTEVLFDSGSITDDEETAGGYNGNAALDGTYDGQIMRYDYTFGDYGVAVSAEIDDTGANDPVLGIGFRASFDFAGTGLNFGIGYQEVEDDDALGMSLNANFGSISAGINYSEYEVAGDDIEHIGIGVGYSSGPISLHANYGEFDRDIAGDSDGFGLTAGYDLGGGAILQAGYGTSDFDGADDFDSYSLGVRLNF